MHVMGLRIGSYQLEMKRHLVHIGGNIGIVFLFYVTLHFPLTATIHPFFISITRTQLCWPPHDRKLLDDSGEVPKTRWSDWQLDCRR